MPPPPLLVPRPMVGLARLPPSPSLMPGPHPLHLPPPAAQPQHCRHRLARVLPPLSRPLLSQKRPPPLPLQTPPVALGSPPETVAHRHQWCRPSSLHPTAPPPSSSPYKRVRSTPGHHHTHPRSPLLALESSTPTSPSTDRRQPSLSAAPSFPHLLSSDEPTNVLAAASSTSPAPSPVTLSPGVAGDRAPVSSRGRPWHRYMVNRRHPWSTNCGLGPRVFHQQNNSMKILFPGT
jgi:hypothetical protein